MHAHGGHVATHQRHHEVRQSADVIEMRVREENIQRVGFQIPLYAEKTSSRIQNNSGFREHQTGGVSPFTGVVAPCAEKPELHGGPNK